ncbi:hypothetical protein OIU74_025024 [Salix koriyanagi]|uniref:Uncharacterized protein n=1 Tax=Salix koriyanagi TaxID=2511006 RepID=A0A9Q1A8M9_9ROSI|nr:hypothetical protein OIU74_025024 [Salix koriyanagi]
MSAYGVSLPLMLLLLLLANVIDYNEASASTSQVNGSATTSNEMVPLMEPLKVMEIKMMMNESRRRLNGFQICAMCTCCGGAKGAFRFLFLHSQDLKRVVAISRKRERVVAISIENCV